jgi:hypothetical protein
MICQQKPVGDSQQLNVKFDSIINLKKTTDSLTKYINPKPAFFSGSLQIIKICYKSKKRIHLLIIVSVPDKTTYLLRDYSHDEFLILSAAALVG